MLKYLLLFIPFFSLAQTSPKELDRTVKVMNKESVPYIRINEAKKVVNKHMLDAREKREFQVSHINKAIYVGYDSFDIKTVTNQIKNKQDTIIVYCSIGIRSEDIGEKLLAAGYTNVFNLYGGIFEWKNHDNEVYNTKEEKTEEVHAYSKYWSKFLNKGQPIYE